MMLSTLLSFPDRLERWIAYRTYDRYNIVKTDLKPNYYDTDTRLLHANFSLLAQFVEIELAQPSRSQRKSCSWLEYLIYHIRWPSLIWRLLPKLSSREYGLEYLDSRINDPENDFPDFCRAEHAEIKSLYLWWKDIRPARSDPHDCSGLTAFYDRMHSKYGAIYRFIDVGNGSFEMKRNLTEEEDKEYVTLIHKSMDIEKAYDDEDTEMLERLIRIRNHLWT